MCEWVGWLTMVLAVAGCVLLNRKKRYCFLLWMVSNLLSAGLHVGGGMWPLVVRDVIFFALAIEGWFRWGICRHENTHDENILEWGTFVEVCDDCGMSRSVWEQGESDWQRVDVEELKRDAKATG